ncbi:hypothetical protein SPONL_1863 [uncultured Candidatus Thioglobus sp.]|nr:hypothetical protein SPONL_1863 [uncultured Candidatus Thioglobus sp.]
MEACALGPEDECLHIAASRIIVEEIDTVLDVSPNMDFNGNVQL